MSSSWRREYNLTDHLGNVRATFHAYQMNTPFIIQQDNYYPFGLRIPNLTKVIGGNEENNGKELEDEFGLDWYHYGWRFYDPTVARWWSIDPAEQPDY